MPFFSDAASLDEQIKHPVLLKALEELKNNRSHEAARILSEYKPDPESLPQYHFVFSRAMSASKKPLEALEHLRLAYLYSPDKDMKESLLLERAEMYLKMGYFEEAKYNLLVFIKNFPGSVHIPRARLGLAKSLASLGYFREAIESYEKADNSAEVLFGKADALHCMGRIKEADEVYTSAFLKDASYLRRSRDTQYYLGENLRRMNKLNEAKKYLSSVKDISSRNRAEISLGLISMEESKINEAMKYFKSALSSNNRYVKRQALLNLARAEIQTGKTDEAVSHLLEIRYKYPYGNDYDDALLALAGIYKNSGKFTDAMPLLKELVFRPAPKKEALDEFEKIILAAKQKDRDKFAEIWRSVGHWLIDSSREQFLLSIATDLKKDEKQFLEIVNYLSRHGSNAARSWSFVALAEVYSERGDPGAVTDCLKNIKTIKGAGDETLKIDAMLSYSSGNFSSAADKFMSVKKMDINDIKIFGKVIGHSKDISKAASRYERAIKETGGDPDSYIRIGDIFFDMNRKAEALNYYKLALGKEPENKWALYRAGILSDAPEAEKMFRKIESGQPVLSSMASAGLKEIHISKMLKENF